MKKWHCDGCNKEVEVADDYIPENCCNGHECGCYGKPINPALCVTCVEQIFGKQTEFSNPIFD